MWVKRHLFVYALLSLISTSKSVFGAEDCQSQSNHIVANSYITPFGLVTSDTGNVQWVATTTCSRFGGYVEHVQRFNGGRDNTIIGAFYRMPINDAFTVRFAVDHLDVDEPSIEVPRARLQLEYKGALTVSAEAFLFHG